MVEIYRVNLFDLVTSYRAIFADHEFIDYHHSKINSNLTVSEPPDFNDSLLLTSWLGYKIGQFLNELETSLNRCIEEENSSQFQIESLIDPCFYFGLSMSRVGADFRPLLVPIFEKIFLKRFQKSINRSIQIFEKSNIFKK